MLFIAFLLWVAAELLAFIAVGDRIGFFWDLVLLIGVSAAGPLIVRRVGVGVLTHTRRRLADGEVPTREVLDGVVVLMGGALICVPGFVGDALGLLLMIGPVRHLLIRLAGFRLARRIRVLRPRRWESVDARSRPAADWTAPPGGMLGPGPGGPT